MDGISGPGPASLDAGYWTPFVGVAADAEG